MKYAYKVSNYADFCSALAMPNSFNARCVLSVAYAKAIKVFPVVGKVAECLADANDFHYDLVTELDGNCEFATEADAIKAMKNTLSETFCNY